MCSLRMVIYEKRAKSCHRLTGEVQSRKASGSEEGGRRHGRKIETWVGNISTFRTLAVRDLLLRQELGFILSEREQKKLWTWGLQASNSEERFRAKKEVSTASLYGEGRSPAPSSFALPPDGHLSPK